MPEAALPGTLARHPILTFGALLSGLLTVAFAIHVAVMMSTRWSGEVTLRVEGWMSPGYVVHVLGLPKETLAPLLGLAEAALPFRTINDLAAERGEDSGQLIAQIDAALQEAIVD